MWLIKLEASKFYWCGGGEGSSCILQRNMESQESLTAVKRSNGVGEGKEDSLVRAKVNWENQFDRENFPVT